MILISEFMDEKTVEKLRQHQDVIYRPDLFERDEELFSLVVNSTALIVRNRTRVISSLLKAAPSLACVGRLGVGLDNIDLEACRRRKITVYPATGANDRSVAEYVVCTAVMLLRRAYSVNDRMQRGEWPREECTGAEAMGKTLGLLGLGAIGQQTAQLAALMGFSPIAYDPFLPQDSDAWRWVRQVDLPQLLGQSDVISVHVPLTKSTRHLLGDREIKQIKKGAMVINTSRGGIVDESALIAACQQGHLGGFALDVFDNEPLDGMQGQRFCHLDNVILTPHIAGVTTESNERVSDLIATKVMAHLDSLAST